VSKTMNTPTIDAPEQNGHNPIGAAVGEVLAARSQPAARMPLAPLERVALQAIQTADRAVYEQHVAPLQRQEAEVRQQIEQRLGLETGAIGRTHGIDPQTWELVPMPQQQAG
jgi:predicted PhzF superfamily epimerase YddE/YHI9